MLKQANQLDKAINKALEKASFKSIEEAREVAARISTETANYHKILYKSFELN